MNYIYAKHFREFEEFTVEKIYPFYRNGGVVFNDKFIPKTFKHVDGKLLEEKWTDGTRELVPCSEKLDKEFFKTYKKVFDVVIKLPKEQTVDGVTADTFAIKGLGAFKVKEMLKADFDYEVPMDEEHEKFNWEDDVYTNIEGKTYKMKVRGEKLDTEYKIQLKG